MLLAGMLLGCNRSGVVMPETYGPRPPHEGSSPYSDRVIAYVPAPGQFINDAMVGFDGNETGPQSALEYADRRLHSVDASLRGMVSLGGFGGYIVVGTDYGYHFIFKSQTISAKFLDNRQPVLREFRTGRGVGDAR